MTTYTVKKGSTAAYLRFQLRTSRGPVDLTDYDEVQITTTSSLGVVKIDHAVATITDVANAYGQLQYPTNGIDTAGIFNLEFNVHYTNGKNLRIPDSGFDELEVEESIS